MSGAASTKFSFSITFPDQGGGTNPAVGPFIIPPRLKNATPNNDLALYFSGYCVPATTSATKGIQPGEIPQQKAFGLSFTQSGSSPNPVIKIVQITVVKQYIFSAQTADREILLTSFRLFAGQLEKLEVSLSSATGGLLPCVTEALLYQIALNMPLTLSELLQFTYHFNINDQYIDLEPGFSLTIAAAGYQYIAPPASPGYGLNAFTLSGTQTVSLGWQQDGKLSFNGFASRFTHGVELSPPTPPDENYPCLIFAASPIDLQLSGNARRHWRLITPSSLPSPQNVDNSGSSSVDSALLLGADTYTDLAAATEAAIGGGQFCITPDADNNPIVAIAFTSRVFVTPAIGIFVNDIAQQVPVGTSMRDIVFQYLLVPPAHIVTSGSNVDSTSLSCKLQRWVANSEKPFSSTSPGPTVQVDYFDFSPDSTSGLPLSGPDGDVFDIPLLKGDRIYVGPKDGYQLSLTE
ncbi:hypothetical protein AW40_01815 [Kosakonia radicincitans UMEnt01/12]|uniref:hypothetical protein n=1 Tax=Kosakonia radicincitans TaxID=283686 RepID=UPI00046203C8|nr:hypothetical protein [Kosakonia radicincitans]KDE38377.1 hypothetical protein AW40_01815 [Kosakonia radicincitans UMEnt01/12]